MIYAYYMGKRNCPPHPMIYTYYTGKRQFFSDKPLNSGMLLLFSSKLLTFIQSLSYTTVGTILEYRVSVLSENTLELYLTIPGNYCTKFRVLRKQTLSLEVQTCYRQKALVTICYNWLCTNVKSLGYVRMSKI